MHGNFFFLVFVHVVVGWWFVDVEGMGKGGLRSAATTTAAAVSASAIAHRLRREVRTKATMAVNSVGRPIIMKGTEVGVIYIMVDALLEEARVAEWDG